MEQQGALEEQSLEGQNGQGPLDAQTTAIVATPKPIWRRVFETLQGLRGRLCRALKGAFGLLQTFTFWVMVVFTAILLFGGWIHLQPLKRAAGWLHPLERVNAYSWCISTNEGWPSVGQDYPAGPQAPSVQIAPWLWCNPRYSSGKALQFRMRNKFPHLS